MADPNQFYLGTDDYPAGEGNYFRAVATAPGQVQSLSIPYGPFTFVTDPPSTVTIQVNGVTVAPNDIDSGSLLPLGTFHMAATASSGRFIKRLTLLYDGNTIGHFDNGATTGGLDYTTNIPGDHIIEAYATDDLGVTGAAAPIHVRILPAAPRKAFVMTASGAWNDPANWIDSQGNHGVPGANDFAIVSTYSPTISTAVTVNAMSLNGGTLNGTNTLTVTGFCTIADGTIKANLTIPSGSTCECLNDTDIALTGTLTYAGRMRLHGKGGIGGLRTPANRPTLLGPQPDGLGNLILGAIHGVGNFIADLASGGRRGSKATPAPRPPIAPETRIIAAATINIAAGTVTTIPAPAKLLSQDGGGVIARDGAGLISQDGGGLVAQGAGNLVAQGAGNLVAQGAGNLLSQDGGGLLATGGSMLVASGAGNLVAQGAGNLVAQGAGNLPTGGKSLAEIANTAGISLTGGELDLSGFTIYGNISMDGGTLKGSGLVLGDLTNNSGVIVPGHGSGGLGVTGSFTQGANGILFLEIGGAHADQFDHLEVLGTATFGGTLDVALINGYTPDPADTFNPLGYSAVSGAFASVSSNAQVTFNPTGIVATVNPAIPNPTPIPTVATFSALSPARVWDSRSGPGPTGQVGAGQSRDITVTDVGGVPATGVTAVVLNVAAVNPSAQTFATVWPTGEAQPLAANLNVPPGDVRANLVVVKVGAGGKVSVFNNSGNVDFVADVAGWYGPGAGDRYAPVSPARIWDTRSGPGPTGRIEATGSRNVMVTGLGGVPATGVSAVVLNVAAVNPSARTFITAWPAGEARPLAANLNIPAGDVRANLVYVKVGASGQVSFYNNAGDVDVVADVAGYFSATGSQFHIVSPTRIWDTRSGPGPIGQIGSGGSQNLTVTDVAGVPATGATAVVLNVAAVHPSARTFITAWPAGEAQPLAANLNVPAGDVRPNLAVVKIGAGGQTSFYNNAGSVDLVADLAGWYGPPGE
ncbi:MAG: hypothetical protein M3176_08695 [Chloroflexota bacterium]|nr:hypothetical protein [Chloroflexota bacterium]